MFVLALASATAAAHGVRLGGVRLGGIAPLSLRAPRSLATRTASLVASTSTAALYSPPGGDARNDEDARLAQTIEELKDARRTAGSVLLLGALNSCLTRSLAACGLASFPPSLLGMALVFACLSLADRVSPSIEARATGLLRPGVTWLTRWMPVFFAPALVSLPAALGPLPAAELARLPIVIIGGYLLTLVTTALAVGALPADGATGAASAPAPARSGFSRPFVVPLLTGAWATTGVLLALLCACGCAPPAASPLVQTHALALLCCLYAAAEKLPAKARGVLHPTLLAGTATWAALRLGAGLLAGPAVQAASAGGGAEAGVAAVGVTARLIGAFGGRGGQGAVLGGGGALLNMLPLTVLGFGLQLHDRRAQLRSAAPRIAVAAAVGALTGVGCTALGARALGLSPSLARALLTRTITAPLAQLAALSLGASGSLAVATTVVSGLLGANFGQKLLKALGVKDAVTVGLAMGTSAHGLGTAALSEWPEALAFSALALALNGLLIAAFLVSPLGAATVRLLLGA